MIRRPPRSTLDRSSAASDVYKRQVLVPDINQAAALLGQPRGPVHVRVAKEGETGRHALLGECLGKDVVNLHCLGIFAASTTRDQRLDSLTKKSRRNSGVLARGSDQA